MKKIGIITIQRSEVNYGACLQCYALWSHINENLGSCQVIDLLRPCHTKYIYSRGMGEKPKMSTRQKIRQFVYNLFRQNTLTKEEQERLKKFREFNDKVQYSSSFRSVESLYKNIPDYDVYVSGSDQIWNPNMPFMNQPYLLEFVADGKKRISYASSFGVDKIDDISKTMYKYLLTKYSYISVREETGAQIVEEILGQRPQVVLDPVFLLNREEWTTRQRQPDKFIKEKYILLYMLKYNKIALKKASELAKKKGLKLYVVLSENRTIETPLAKQLINIGPAEWLWLIDNAETMLTTSFHGTAFSIIFKTPVIALIEQGKPTNSRLQTLLSRFGLQELVVDINAFDVNVEHDYNNLFDSLTLTYERECNRAKDFLTKAITDDKN